MAKEGSHGANSQSDPPIAIRHSLTTHTLISMGIRVTLVVVAVSLLSYWHIVQTLEVETYDKLEKYIQERGEKESTIFKFAQTYHRIFSEQYLSVLEQSKDVTAAEYSSLFERQPGGTTRLRKAYYDGVVHPNGMTSRYNSSYISKTAPINDQDFRNRLVHAYRLVDRFGPAWVDPFANLYASFPENASIVHWPHEDWGRAAADDFDITAQEWFYLADPAHNPARTSVWTGLYYDQTSDRWMVSCETPIDLNGRHLINIGSDYMLNDLIDRVINDHLDGSYNFIFREDGRLIAHPDKVDALSKAQQGLNIVDTNDPLLKSLYQQAMAHIDEDDGQPVVFIDETNELFLAVSKIDGPGWWFATVYPKELLSSTARSTAEFIFFLSAISLVLELLMLYLVLRYKVVKPLKMFVEASWDVKQGKYDEVTSGHLALPEERKDEVGLLARMLRSMSGTIADNIEALQHLGGLKDEFMANTSHELRTPLNGIVGIAESMLDGAVGELSDKQLYNLSLIATSGQRLSHLVNDILDFSQLRHQELELQLKPTDIFALVNTVILLSGPLVKNSKVTLLNRINKRGPPVYADENRVQQILYNIIGNAIKFTNEGTITVSSKVDKKFVCITVSDTGIGIAQDKLAKVFDSFEQAEGTTARVYGGTGLGLAVTKQLVELHKGTIKVKSKQGEGASFSFTLPISKLPIDAKQNDPSGTMLNKVLSGPLGNGKDHKSANGYVNSGEAGSVLVVDDEPINIQVLHNHLSLNDYTITTAANGKQALALIDKHDKFDAVLLDVMMPGMTGFEVCQRIRQVYPANRLPVLMVTAKNRIEDLSASFAAGANDFLTKPVVKAELLERVKTQISVVRLNEDLNQANQQLKSHADGLDHLVQQRTRQLQQRGLQLAQTNKQLMLANQKINKSSGNVQMLEQLGRYLTSTLDLNQVIDNIYQILNNVLDAQILLLGILDQENHLINVPLIVEHQKKLEAVEYDLDDINRPAVWCVNHKKELLIMEEADVAKYFDQPMPLPKLGKQSKTIVYQPLIIGEKVVGCLSVQNMDEHAYSAGQIDMIRTLASYSAIAMANALGYKKLQQTHDTLLNTQKQLVLQEKMASLGNLTAGVAHEINNPINFIHVGAENLSVDLLQFENFLFELADEDGADEAILASFKAHFEPLYQHLTTIKSGSRRIKNIVEDLRAFTHLDNAERKAVNIVECISSTLNLIQTQNIDIAQIITDLQPVPELVCFPAQINQVFMNIIVNSCDAIREKQKDQHHRKPGQIHVGCRLSEYFIVVTIQDSGCGMSDEVKSQLFEPFFTTKVVGKGTGLGMAISFGIIEDHGGTIEVETELGVGTKITIYLPVV